MAGKRRTRRAFGTVRAKGKRSTRSTPGPMELNTPPGILLPVGQMLMDG